MIKYYPTVKSARNALCLDIGFDPFLSGDGADARRKSCPNMDMSLIANRTTILRRDTLVRFVSVTWR